MAKTSVIPNVSIAASLIRPNDTDVYTAGDVIGNTTNVLQETFALARVPGGSGRIISASLALTSNGFDVLALSAELWLFDAAVDAHEVDNATFTPTEDDMLKLVGVLQFLAADAIEGHLTAGAAGTVAYMAAQTFLPLGFTCEALSQNLHGTLVSRNAYTPTALEQFYLRVSAEQD